MKTPEIPQNDKARVQALRALGILDTLPDERFDRLTRMSKRIFGVPIALVSLVDDHRQWFKSSVGLEACETSRDVSFCGHAILRSEVFVVPNALEDERFADNPLVTGDPKIRFYTGCPLTVNGHKLGTLCIIDKTPRIFGKEDIQMLEDLAALVERELDAIAMAARDELTQISNRRGFLTLAEQTLSICVRQELPATLVFLDLDKFKPINDEQGHAEGDRALTTFASQMKSCVRQSDVCARLGGDEFAILLANSNAQQAQGVANRLLSALRRLNHEEDRGYEIEFSHGIVEFDPECHAGIHELMAEGDAIMYEAKRAKT